MRSVISTASPTISCIFTLLGHIPVKFLLPNEALAPDSDTIGTEETFQIEHNGGNRVIIKASNDRYLCLNESDSKKYLASHSFKKTIFFLLNLLK